jgi:streptogramin lyase
MKNLIGKVSVATALLFAWHAATAGTLSGIVKDNSGQALEGVMIRLTDPVSGMSESIFSNASGEFSLTTALQGELTLRLRTPYHRDFSTTVDLADEAIVYKELSMEVMTDEVEISNSLPAAYHFGGLDFETGEDAVFSRYQFQRDCLSCHQMGNSLSRFPRTPEQWEITIERMHRYVGSNFDEELRKRRSHILSQGFNGEPLTVRPQFPLDESLSRVKIYEYRMEKGVIPHDAIVNPKDGLIYTVDQGADHMAITDTVTGKTEYISQKGGTLWIPFWKTKTMDWPFERFGPHSLAMGLDGKYYTTNSFMNSIGVFNPEIREWEPSIFAGVRAIYPHTVRIEKNGMVWFTIAGRERVGRVDPVSKESTLIDLPDAESGGLAGGTQPYGIDINPADGSIWYSRLFGDKIGRFDPDTLKVQEFDSPVRGPRRMRFDQRDGTLWLTGYSEGKLARITTSANGFESKVYSLPEFAEGYGPAPYALGVHPRTGDVWLNENMTDRFFRFIPEEERFVVYPAPLTGTYTRDFSFTEDGKACTSNNPLPIAALEGGVAEIICIELMEKAPLIVSRATTPKTAVQ